MTTVKIITTNSGRNIYLHRGNTVSPSSTQYLPLTQVQYGVNGSQPTVGSNSLEVPIPILDGTVLDDGSNTFTGSNGGANSTDNTSVFKEGAGTSDATAQNLITTGSNVTKTWTISSLTSNADSSQYVGVWFYIKDQATLDKFEDAGTVLEFRLGVDSTTNYYSQVWTKAQLSVGWNWLSDAELLSTWTVNGTPGTLNDFQINITTNNAADAFVAGDVVVDALRQWTLADTKADFTIGYPTFNYTNNEVTRQNILTTVQANGFLIDKVAFVNEDTTPLYGMIALIVADSKSSSDLWRTTNKERLI